MGKQSKIEIILTAKDTGLSSGISKATTGLRIFQNQIRDSVKAAKDLDGNLVGVAGKFGALFGGVSTTAFAASIFDAGTKMDQLNKAFVTITGSADSAKQELAFVRTTAEELGLEFTTTANAYKMLTAASKGTTLEGEAARDIFLAISEAATTLGMSVDDTDGALRAIGQMISKGNVQAEELRGQLDERLPGAFQLAARAMGVTTQELDGLLKKGQVTATDMLPKLAAILHNEFGKGALDAASGPVAALNRFKNAWFELRVAIADSGFMAIATGKINDLTAAMNDPKIRQTVTELATKFFTMAEAVLDFTVNHGEAIVKVTGGLVALSALSRTVGLLTGIWKGLNAAMVFTTGLQLIPYLSQLRASLDMTKISALGVAGALGAAAGSTLAFLGGLDIGERIYKATEKSEIELENLRHNLDVTAAKLRQFAGFTPETQDSLMTKSGRELDAYRTKLEGAYKLQVATVQSLTATSKQATMWGTQTDEAKKAQVELAAATVRIEELEKAVEEYGAVAEKAHRQAAARALAEQQAATMTNTWDAYEERLKTASTQMEAARSASELAIAQKALQYEQQGMEKREAEVKLTKEKLDLIDQEIAKYNKLKEAIPATDGDKKSRSDAVTELNIKINSLSMERIGLLQQEIEVGRRASEEATKNAEKAQKEAEEALEAQQRLNDEKMRFASQAKIMAMEVEKLEASKLPTALARAEADLAIDKRIVAERINLRQQEIASLKSRENVDPANIFQAEEGLLDLQVQLERIGVEGRKNLARLKLDDIGETWRRSAESVAEYRAAVEEALDSGAITQKEYNERMIASGDDMGAALSLGFSKAAESWRTDAELMIQIGSELPDRLSSELSSAFDSIIDGSKSAKEAFADMARSTINWLSQIILKQLLSQAIGYGPSTSADGAVTEGAGLIGAVMGMFAEGGQVQALASGGSVRGWSPHSRADNIPIWATAGEFMQPVRAVRYYGFPFMEAVRTLRIPKQVTETLSSAPVARFPSGYRLAQGGMVPGPAPATTLKAGDTRLKVVNVIDKNLIGDFMKSADGETVLLNMIRRNGSVVKTIIG